MHLGSYKNILLIICGKITEMMFGELPTYFAAATCYIGIFSMIFIIGYPSPTQKQLVDDGLLDYYTLPIFASINHLTRTIALIMVPILVQFNASIYIIVSLGCLIGLIGWVCVIMAESALLIIVGMSLLGVYTGVIAVFVYTYVPEVCLDSQRRLMSGGLGFSVRISLFFTYLVGIWLSYCWMAIAGISIICIFCMMLLFNPMSPPWYISHGLDERAKNTLIYLHAKDIDADAEMQNIKSEISVTNSTTLLERFKLLVDWKIIKPIIIMCGFGSLKELGGHEAMVAFSSHILETQHAMDPKVASLFYPIFLVIGAIVSLSLLNYCRLKWQLIIAIALQALAQASMALYYLISEDQLQCHTINSKSHICRVISFWPISNIALYSFGFALGWGLIYFTLIGIMFPIQRELSSGVTDSFTNMSAYVVIMVFYFLLHSIGGFLTFLLLSFEHIVAIVYVYFLLNL